MKRKITIIFLLVLLVIQFFHPKKNVSSEIMATDITKVTNVPQDVQQILQVACYDCHSNNTRYPWYSKIQPVSWWLNRHINNGKRHLNFSDFGSYTDKKARHKLEEVVETLEKDEMPLFSYTLVHRDAKLTAAQKSAVINWAKTALP
ncbi:MAG: heme-binding domain-containing protein [Chitinophagales bacterium]|nr:heme-binding domain-containing protein [Bacteroidota bacterium]